MKYFVWDTETTGVNCAVDRLVEIAAVQLFEQGLEVLARFETYVNPERDIPPGAKAVHHIVEHMVADAPLELQAVSMLFSGLHVLDGDIFVAHNARFDRGFLRRISPEREKQVIHICTMKCAKVIWPNAPSYANQFLRYWLNLEVDVPPDLAPHRALYDVIVTAAIFAEELKHMSIDDMIKISNAPILLKKMPIGKHKDLTFNMVPGSYLRWILSEEEAKPGSFDEDLLFTCRHWLNNGRSFR